MCASDSDLFLQGDYISNLSYYDNVSSKSKYGFEVLLIEDNKATIRIFKN